MEISHVLILRGPNWNVLWRTTVGYNLFWGGILCPSFVWKVCVEYSFSGFFILSSPQILHKNCSGSGIQRTKNNPYLNWKKYFLNVNTCLLIIDLNPLCSPRSLKVDMPFPKVLNFLPTEILRLAIIKTLLSYCFILPNDFMETLFVVLTLNIYFTLRRFNTYFIYSSQKKIKTGWNRKQKISENKQTFKNVSKTKYLATHLIQESILEVIF